MSNNTTAPDVNDGEQNVPTNLSEQSGLPNMSSTKVFKVETDTLVLGDVYANNFIGNGAAAGTYATQVGFNANDPLDVASLVMDAGTDGTDGYITISNITADGTVDFTGATLIGIPDLVGISLTDLSVSVNAVGVANLAYDNTTGVFTYTPPDLSTFLTASSTATLTNKSGSNSQWTNDEGFTTNTGTTTADNVQTFTNKTGSNSQWTNDENYIDLTDLSVTVATEGTANLSYNNANGTLTYTPPSFAGYLPLSGGTLTDDLVFEAGGVTVGSIGASLGGLYIADTGVGFRFDAGGTDDIIPCNETGAVADDSINLGSSGARFKDIHLSGNAFVAGNVDVTGGVVFGTAGGNVASKTLSDYEQGFWTPSFGGSGVNPTVTYNTTGPAEYVKVGKVVTVSMAFFGDITAAGSGQASIQGLPFVAKGSRGVASIAYNSATTNATSGVSGYVEDNQSYILLHQSGSVNAETWATGVAQRIFLSITYIVD